MSQTCTAVVSPHECAFPDATVPRILVVDDEALICDLVEELLSGMGAFVVTERDGAAALRLLEREPFDLVLTDLKLGQTQTDGMQIMQRALELYPGIIVILMTGFPTLENAVSALKSGAYDYVTKPFTIDSIRAVVQRGLEHLHLQKENIQLREAANLKRITEALGSTLELNEVLQVVLKSALSEVQADYGAVLLDNRENRHVRLAAEVGEGGPPDLTVLYPAENHERWREACKKPVLLAQGEAPPCPGPFWTRENTHSVMSVPLWAKGEFIGVVHVSREKIPAPFTEANLRTLDVIASQATFAIENAKLYDSLHRDYMAIIRSLANAVEAKDPYTRGHGDRVVKYTQAIGTRISLDAATLEKLKVAAILHDIGKIGIRDDVLLKPGPLSDEEYREMKLHPIIGDRILAPIKSLEETRVWIYQHHERLDGKGYPEGVTGSDLLIPSRTLIVAEVFDALVTERSYKPAWPLPKVQSFLLENVDTHFDREIVEAFVDILNEEGEAFYRNNIVVY